MSGLFLEADENSDGVLSLEEFRNVVSDPLVRTWLASMDLDMRDVDALFRLIGNGDVGITSEQLIVGVERLKGAARSIDLNSLMVQHQELQNLVASCQDEAPGASVPELPLAVRKVRL